MLHFGTRLDWLFTGDYVSELIKTARDILLQSVLILIHVFIKGRDMEVWLQQHLEEKALWLTAPPPTSFQ